MERVSFQEVQRLQAAGENMFVNAVRCYAHASMWHIRGRTIRLLGGQSTQQEDRS